MPLVFKAPFSGGEISKDTFGQLTLDLLQTSAQKIKNMFPRVEGGLDKRPGLQFVMPSLQGPDVPIRQVTFKFNEEQTYNIALQPNLVYFMRDGGAILDGGFVSAGALVDLDSDPTQSVVQTSVPHQYTTGDVIFAAEFAAIEISNQFWRVEVISPNAFILKNVYTDVVVSSQNYSFTLIPGSPVNFNRVYTLTTADGWFNGVDVSEIDYSGLNDVMYLAHPSGPTKVLTRMADNDWALADFSPTADVDPPTPVTITSQPPGGSPPVDILYAITAINSDTFEESLAEIVEVVNSNDPTDLSPVILSWPDKADARIYRVYKAIGGIYGIVGSVEDPNPGTLGDTLTFRDNGIPANLTIAPPLEVSPTFDEVGAYPGAIEFFQQRVFFGRTDNLIRDFYASRSGSFKSFANSTINTPDDPISQSIGARSVQEVRYFLPLRDMVIMTDAAEWGFDNGELGVISSSSGLINYSFWGCGRVKPELIGDSAIFVDNTLRTVRDLSFSAQVSGFASTDLSVVVKHLFKNREVVSIAYSDNPYSIIFFVMSDGRGLSCTYVKDQQVFAWAQHDTNGRMLDVNAVREDGLDNLYVTVERTANVDSGVGVNYIQIERMIMDDPQRVEDGIYLDNSVDAFSSGSDLIAAVRVVGSKFEIRIAPFIAPGAQIRIFADKDSPIRAINGMVFIVQESDNPGPDVTNTWRTLHRPSGSGGLGSVLFDASDFLPSGLSVSAGLDTARIRFTTATARMPGHLSTRSGSIVTRTDRDFSTGNDFQSDSVTLAEPASVIHFGEEYETDVTTLPLDDLNDPITGLPVHISDVRVRLSLASRLTIGRLGFSGRDFDDSLAREEGFNTDIGSFEGVLVGCVPSEWSRKSNVFVRTADPFPLKLSAIVPNVKVGNEYI